MVAPRVTTRLEIQLPITQLEGVLRFLRDAEALGAQVSLAFSITGVHLEADRLAGIFRTLHPPVQLREPAAAGPRRTRR